MRSLNNNPSKNLVWGPLVGSKAKGSPNVKVPVILKNVCTKKIFVRFFKGDIKITSNKKSENITKSVFLNASRDVFGFLITFEKPDKE